MAEGPNTFDLCLNGRSPEAYGSHRVSFHEIAVRIFSAIAEN